MARIPRANHASSPQYIYERKPFDCNSMSGRWQVSLEVSTGELNDAEVNLLREHIRGAQAYIVYSYSTPIAWWTETYGWHAVNQKFSPTTSKHQSRLHLVR